MKHWSRWDEVDCAQAARRIERLWAVLDEYQCPGLADCPVPKLKDGSCLHAATGHCGDAAFKALNERS